MADILINILGDASKLKGELDKAGKNVTRFSDKMVKIGKIATTVGIAVTAAFTAIVLKTAAVGDQFDKMSLRTGIAVEDLSALAYAADISGTDIGTLEKGLKGLTKVMDDASMGIGEGMEAFEYLDIAVVDTEGNLRSTVDVLKEAATKIAAVEDPTKQAALAMDLFGSRAGPQLLPLLKMGEEGIEELMEEAKRLNITMSTEAAKAAADFTDAMTGLKGSLAGAGRMIGDTLIPALTPLIEKATEIVVKIVNWTKENAELTEKIFKWAAGIGALMLVLGPLAVILPSVVAGVILLKGAFVSLVATGALVAITAGVMLLHKGLRESIGGLAEYREELKAMKEVKETEAVIDDLQSTVDQLNKRFLELGFDKLTEQQKKVNLGYQTLMTVLDETNIRLEMAKERKAEIIYLQETGVELTYEEIKTLEELNKKIKEEEKRINALIESIKGEIAGIDELSYQMKILTAEYELATTGLSDYDEIQKITLKYYQDMLEAAEKIVKVKKAERDALKEGTIEWDAAHLAYLEAQKVVKDLKEVTVELIGVKKLELEGLDLINAQLEELENRYEVIDKDTYYYTEKIKLLNEQEEYLAEKLKEATEKFGENSKEVHEATMAYINCKNKLHLLWQEMDIGLKAMVGLGAGAKATGEAFFGAADTSWAKWKDFFTNLASKYKSTLSIIQNGITKFVSSFEGALSNAISSLMNMKEINAEIKIKIAEEEETYREEMAKLQEEYNQAVMTGDNEAAQNALDKMDDIKEKHEEVIEEMEGEQVTFQSVWKTFWNNLKTAAVNALAEIIAQLVIMKGLMMIFSWFGWTWPFGEGGGVGLDLGGQVKKFQFGGMADTIPARLTIGEYVIAKPMTDFIKRFKMIPSNLVEAISGGLPTPVPAFAGGGSVGNPNIITSSFGETKIYVDVHDNKISDEIDVKRLAMAVSNEILRKINANRRH